MDDLFKEQVWIERQELIYDLIARRTRTKGAFDAYAAYLGPVWARERKTAWARFNSEPDRITATSPVARRQTVLDLTYRPGLQAICEVDGERYLNQWRPPEGLPQGPMSDEDVRIWLDHMALIIPDEEDRRNLFGWMASVAQRQTEKPNHGVVLGGPHGRGKSTLMIPLKAAVGRRNVSEITIQDLESGFTDWIGRTKIFFVEEMTSFSKREMMQRLKTYLAAPPETLQVNPKYGKKYEIANIMTGVFFTNHRDAIAVEKGERRFMVFWTEAERQPAEYYDNYMDWMRGGGAEKAARWLLDYDASYYNMLADAPATSGLEDMRRATRTKIEEWIEDGVHHGAGPFAPDLVVLADLYAHMPKDVVGSHGKPTHASFGNALLRAGATRLRSGRKLALGSPQNGASVPLCSPSQARIYILRRCEMYEGLENEKLVELFWQQRARAEADDPWLAQADVRAVGGLK